MSDVVVISETVATVMVVMAVMTVYTIRRLVLQLKYH